MDNCIFCKIANKEVNSDIIYENESVAAFADIHPKAQVHFLIIPKKHIISVDEVGSEDKELMGDLILAAQKIARQKGLKGYKLRISVGREGGQEIDHLHMHLLSGKMVDADSI